MGETRRKQDSPAPKCQYQPKVVIRKGKKKRYAFATGRQKEKSELAQMGEKGKEEVPFNSSA